MRIGLVGAGAIGCWVGANLANTGHSIRVLARGNSLAEISRSGLGLVLGEKELRAAVFASDDAREIGEVDVLLISVKAQAMPSLAGALGGMIGERTVVVPLINGVPWWFLGKDTVLESVDPGGAIAQVVPHEQVVGAVVHGAASRIGPGTARLKMADRIILGEPCGGLSARARQLVELFVEAGLPAVESEEIRSEIWFKLWGNMTMNPISALTLATCDRILDDPAVNAFVLSVMEEARCVGEGVGCRISMSGEARNATTRKLGAFKTSMLQDVESERSLELDALLAAPREIASRLGISTPCMDALYGLTRLMAKSRGLY